MKEVLVKAKIKNLDEELSYEGKGTLDEVKNILQYQDNEAVLTIFLNDNIMLRETTDAILSYKFKENEKTSFEVFLKELNQTGHVPLKTKEIIKTATTYKVEYIIDGNDYYHLYEVNWRVL